ncbi:NADPH-dependent FMN reductase [Micrococcus lylae]
MIGLIPPAETLLRPHWHRPESTTSCPPTPNSDVAWKGLPVGIISHSVGRMGGYSSQKNLRLALSYFDMPTVGQPEVFLSQSPELFAEGDTIVRESTVTFLQNYVDRFVRVIEGRSRS